MYFLKTMCGLWSAVSRAAKDVFSGTFLTKSCAHSVEHGMPVAASGILHQLNLP